jgi:hypothetical protein
MNSCNSVRRRAFIVLLTNGVLQDNKIMFYFFRLLTRYKYKNNNFKNYFFSSFLFLSFSSPSISLAAILSSFRLHSVFLLVPLSPSLSLISLYPFHVCSIVSLSLLIALSEPSFLSFRPIPVFSL